jgi:PT repeat
MKLGCISFAALMGVAVLMHAQAAVIVDAMPLPRAGAADSPGNVADGVGMFETHPDHDRRLRSLQASPFTIAPTYGVPTKKPTKKPKRKPTKKPVKRPTKKPTKLPTRRPALPTTHPTNKPVGGPTPEPTF